MITCLVKLQDVTPADVAQLSPVFVCVVSDQMHTEWPRASVQPDRAAEVHSGEEV